MRTDSARVLYERAVAADPSYLPAQYARRLAHRYYVRRGEAPLRVDLARAGTIDASSDAVGEAACLRLAMHAPAGYPESTVAPLLQLEAQHHATACTALFLATSSAGLVPMRTWAPTLLPIIERASRSSPEVADVWLRLAATMTALGRPDATERASREGLARVPYAMGRLSLELALISTMRVRGDTVRSALRFRALTAAVQRDGRPLLRYYLPANVAATTAAPTEAQLRLQVQLSAAAHSPYHEWASRRLLGAQLTDAGRPLDAVRELDRAVHIADSLDAPLMQLEAYRFRGRAFAKASDWRNAEQDLTAAIARGASTGDAYLLGEAYHNLAHVFEGAGRMSAASRAVDQFVALSAPLTFAQPRMMSLHDAGIIRWKAGWPAASNDAFHDMVSVVDAQERNYFWAGQYFERVGDYAKARDYYARGAERDRDERSLNFGGLARVYQALGRADSAERMATLHDAEMGNERDVPQLPALLAARGRRDTAETIARSWVERVARAGNLHAQVVATNALAEMLLSWGRYAAAQEAASTGYQLAVRINLVEEVIHALRVRGSAALALGATRDGVETLRDAAERVRSFPTLANTVQTEVAYAKALVATGRIPESLDAFDRSAKAVEQATRQLDRDIDRVRYREQQLAPFDGALRVLAGQGGDRKSLEAMVEWSRRRKAAALTLATGVRSAPGATAMGAPTAPPVRLAELQRTLPPDAAIVDLLFPDSTLHAMVITRSRAVLLRLGAHADSLGLLVSRMTAPFHRVYGGRIDLARAPFDVDAARAIGRAVLAPLDTVLRETPRVLLIPDGPLNAVPFDALLLSDGTSERYAVDRYEFTLASSLNARARRVGEFASSTARRRRTRVLAVVHDAPGVEREARAVRASWPTGQVTIVRDEEATESAVLARAGDFDVLHFATHATADDRDPLASHLALAADAMNDGYLHLTEIANRRLPAPLVVLSACETLAGPLYAGEGLMGLARAFLMSGAREVVATAWPNGDASADLMRTFHARLAAGASAAAALREAKLTLRRRAETAHPFFWAGFVNITASPDVWVQEGAHPQGRT